MAKSKIKRNERKCKVYRMNVGKPRGPGLSGNKSGKGWNKIAAAKKAKPAEEKAEAKPKKKEKKK